MTMSVTEAFMFLLRRRDVRRALPEGQGKSGRLECLEVRQILELPEALVEILAAQLDEAI